MKNNEWPDTLESRSKELRDRNRQFSDSVMSRPHPSGFQRAANTVMYISAFGLLILVSGAAVAAVIALGIWLVRLALGM